MTEEQLKDIEKLNLPLIDRSVKQEISYTIQIFYLCTVFFLIAFFLGHIFAATFLFGGIVINFLQSRLLSYSLDRQMEINTKAMLDPPNTGVEKNTWNQIVSVLHWISFGLYIIGGISLLTLK